MYQLGQTNLFTSHFVIGCVEVIPEHTKTKIDEIKALQQWLYFKDNDLGMKKYRTKRTQYIDFIHFIPLTIVEEVLNDLFKNIPN